MDGLYANEDSDMTATLPVGDMGTITTADGETIQPIVYDRYIYANRNSRLRSQGDMIRGDLPIVPCGGNWFRPSVHPNLDLQQGAMNVMGGNDNQTANELAELIYKSSGNTETSIAGVNQSTKLNASSSAGMRDLQVTAFP